MTTFIESHRDPNGQRNTEKANLGIMLPGFRLYYKAGVLKTA